MLYALLFHRKRIVNRKTKVRTFLNDIRLLAVLWNCIPDANRGSVKGLSANPLPVEF